MPISVHFVVGVTPGKWARVWGDRMPRNRLLLSQSEPADAITALRSGAAQFAFLRDSVPAEEFHRIALYTESPVVVAPKGHLFEAADVVTASDLVDEKVLEDAWSLVIELVAANVGVAIMPQSVARALSRRDVIARPYQDAAATEVGLVWLAAPQPEPLAGLIQEFIGVVRGRTANSSRSA